MASSVWKLNALIKKNLLEMKRNIFSTLCEILFPIILMLLLYWLKTAFDINTFEFDIVEGTLDNFISSKSISNIDSETLIKNPSNWNGLKIWPALSICSKRPIIATIGIGDEIKSRLINDSLLYKSFTNWSLSKESFKDFDSEEMMDNYIESSLYGEDKAHPLICMGLSLKEDSVNHKYDYSLHYFENGQEDGAQDVPKSLYLIDQF